MDLKPAKFSNLILNSHVFCYYSKINRSYTIYGFYLGLSSTGTHKFVMRGQGIRYFNNYSIECLYRSIDDPIIKLDHLNIYLEKINFERCYEEFSPFLHHYADLLEETKKKPHLLYT